MVLMLMVRRLIAVRWSWCFSVARYWVDLKSPESISLIAGHLVLPGAYVFSRDAARSNYHEVLTVFLRDTHTRAAPPPCLLLLLLPLLPLLPCCCDCLRWM